MKIVAVMLFSFLIGFFGLGCSPTGPSLSRNADDVFWITSHGADMPVWVKGNTASKVFLLIVHGGPSAYSLYYEAATATLRDHYGVAYWDQRDAGASAGNSNHADLNLDQMVSDLTSVIRVLKLRYGEDIAIYLYAHSFGGLLASAFLTANDANQNMVAGWLDIDGAHDYPLCNVTSRQMLIDTGRSEIAKGHNTAKWNEIVNYCQANAANVSLAISQKTEDYAEDAENYVPINHTGASLNLFSPTAPFSVGANYLNQYYTAQGTAFLQTLESKNFTEGLARVTVPTLLLWGRYDFTVPLGVGLEAFNALKSSNKTMLTFDQSGHSPMVAQTAAVNQAIIAFVDASR